MLPHMVGTWMEGWTRALKRFLASAMKVFSTVLSLMVCS